MKVEKLKVDCFVSIGGRFVFIALVCISLSHSSEISCGIAMWILTTQPAVFPGAAGLIGADVDVLCGKAK